MGENSLERAAVPRQLCPTLLSVVLEAKLWVHPHSSENLLNLTCRFLANFRPYTYLPLVFATFSLTQHVSCLFLFIATFIRLHNEKLDPRFLVWACILGFAMGYGVWEVTSAPNAGVKDPLGQQREWSNLLFPCVGLTWWHPSRKQEHQVCDPRFPSSHVCHPGLEDPH